MSWLDLPYIFQAEADRPFKLDRTIFHVDGVQVIIHAYWGIWMVELDRITNIQPLLDLCIGTVQIDMPALRFVRLQFRGVVRKWTWQLDVYNPTALRELAGCGIKLPEMRICLSALDWSVREQRDFVRMLYETYVVHAKRITPHLIFDEPFLGVERELKRVEELNTAVQVLNRTPLGIIPQRIVKFLIK